MINAKFKGQKIAIIGLGGTGGFVLDLISKTPVAEIHLYDGDVFMQHNAFRSPGAASLVQLKELSKKVDYYASQYSNMHKHVIPHAEYITPANIGDLSLMSYVFICVDKNSVRKLVMGNLLRMSIPFIDVGLGVEIVDDFLIGAIRVTAATNLKNDHLRNRVATEDAEDEAYASNIQIADLNMMNASMAVIKWKKMSLFYQDLIEYHNSIYTINAAQLTTTDFTV
jgi:tRNA A37 threonylcarbamoyladenosine dehydratase